MVPGSLGLGNGIGRFGHVEKVQLRFIESVTPFVRRVTASGRPRAPLDDQLAIQRLLGRPSCAHRNTSTLVRESQEHRHAKVPVKSSEKAGG